MAAKLLHSLTDENPDLQKQIGCMNGIFQLFDRQPILIGRRIVGHSPKRLTHGDSNSNAGSLEEDSSNAPRRSGSTEKHSQKSTQEKQRISAEPSRPSFSSSSRSSSFSSLDCNRTTHLEPASFDRIIFPETPSRDPTMSLQNSSTQFSRQSLDIRDLVKDSMYREIQGLSVKAKTMEEGVDCVVKSRDSPRPQSKSGDSYLDTKQRMHTDLPESVKPPSYRNEARQLFRSSSFHSRESSSFSIVRDAPRYSYDGREVNREPFDSQDVSRSVVKLKELPRLSLDSRESLNANSKSNVLKSNSGEIDGYQARPPSVVAKLMGLETLPDSVSSADTNFGSGRSNRTEDFVTISSSLPKTDLSSIRVSSSSKNLWKEPSSPRWKNPDSPTKARVPFEPAPWKQIDGMRNSQKLASRSTRAPAKKAPTAFCSVYSEIEKRLKDLEFTQSGKDLRALKQILEAMQSKGFLEADEERHKDHEQKHFSSKHEPRSVIERKPQNDQTLASAKRRTGSSRPYESPIVIMKPAKLVDRPIKDHSSKSSQRDAAAKAVSTKNDRPLRITQTSSRTQQMAKDGTVGVGKGSASISPRIQQKKLELERRSRPPTPPDSSKSRRQSNKQQIELNSPGGSRRLRHPNAQKSDSQLNEVNVVASTSERSPVLSSCPSPSMKASEFMLSNLVEKKSSLALSEEESADFGFIPSEYSSPVSVLDNPVCKDDSPSPVKYVGKTCKVDESMEKQQDSNAVQGSCTSEINRKKLQNIDNLVQKLRRLNSSHDEAHTDYIASLCENTDPDHRYISEILLASGLLLRELGSSLTNFQFHPSGHPINPELFLVLEQTKTNPEKVMIKERFHRKLIFETVNEILARKLASGDCFSQPWLRPAKRRALNAHNLLRDLCSEIEKLQPKTPGFSSDEEDERWKNILCMDLMHQDERWMDFDDEISGAVLDIERSIFKDLVNEIVIGESTGLKSKPGRRSRVFAK